MTPHGMLDPWNMSRGSLRKRLYLALRLRRVLQRASAIHAITSIERDFTTRLKLRPPIIVEPLGLDLVDWNDLPTPDVFRRQYQLSIDAPIIIFLGRIDHGKGWELLIPAFAMAAPKIDPRTRLVIVGPDYFGCRAAAEALATEHQISDRIIFTGQLLDREKQAALMAADLFCLPSSHENFGIAVIEALAAGCPAIVSDQVALHPDITAAQVGGVVPTDVNAIARELERVDERRRASAECGRPRAGFRAANDSPGVRSQRDG